MSDVPKTVEDTPAPAAEPTPVVDATEAAKPSEATAESEPSATVKSSEAEATAVGNDAVPAPAKEETPKDSEAAAEATPASEGLLGYKAPGIFPKFRFHDHFFWLDDAPSTPESLNAYIRSKDLKDLKSAHPNAAWAEETGKGLLFYTKRAEDKSTPAGIINLSEATSITIEGVEEFFFKAHGDKHTFKAKSTAERSSWVVALEKKIEEAKAMKDEIQGSEGYKKHMEAFAKTPAVAATTTAATSTSREQKKSLDATTATNSGANKNVADTDGTTEEKKEKDTKSRSQSRKRSGIFSAFLGKKEEKDEQKEVKKEEVKEEKKEEAKATHEPDTAAEAAVADAGAAVPAAAVVAEEKKDDKHESETTTPTTEKRSKRASIFGSFFSKKDATSPTSEKAEKEAGPSVPAKDAEVLPVSETAPKIEDPIASKPIDTAAVTAPIDTAQTPAAVDEAPTETAKETAPAETATTPTKEKKGGFIGFIKKEAARLGGEKEVKKEETAEKKEEKAAENVSKDTDAAAATTESPVSAEETTAPATEEAKPTDKRRSSLFGTLGGTIRKRTQNAESTDAEATEAGTKREKSPLPQRIGSLFRRPSKGVKSEEPKEATEASTESTPATQAAPVSKDETTVTNGTSAEAPSPAVTGDVVPEALHSTLHGAATTTQEVEASA